MGRAIKMEARIDAIEANLVTILDKIDLIERAIQAGKKKPAKKTKPKKDTLLEVIKEADNE